MFNWFRKKKGKANGKQLNKDTSDSGAFMPIILTSDLDDDKNQTSKSEAAGNDYSYSASFDSSDSGGGGGD